MLVLLVIFMITAPILQSGIEVDVPKTKTVKEISESRVVVSIDRAQRIYIGDDPVNIHELGDKVHAQMHNPQGDADLPALRQDGSLRRVRPGRGHLAPIRHPKYQRRYGAARRDSSLKSMSYAPAHPGADSLKKPFVWSRRFSRASCSARSRFPRSFPTAAISWGSAGGDGSVSGRAGRQGSRNHAAPPRCRHPEPRRRHQQRPVQSRAAAEAARKSRPDAKKIPEFTKEKTPHIHHAPVQGLWRTRRPRPPNAVPYGQRRRARRFPIRPLR